jgi:hypothetical protein
MPLETEHSKSTVSPVVIATSPEGEVIFTVEPPVVLSCPFPKSHPELSIAMVKKTIAGVIIDSLTLYIDYTP